MKARKTMKNNALIQEVISQISQRFSPKIPDIKKVCKMVRCLGSVLTDLAGHRHPIGEGVYRASGGYSRYLQLCRINVTSYLLAKGSHLKSFGPSCSLYVAELRAAFDGSRMNIDIL
jgi:hypothetical protein